MITHFVSQCKTALQKKNTITIIMKIDKPA